MPRACPCTHFSITVSPSLPSAPQRVRPAQPVHAVITRACPTRSSHHLCLLPRSVWSQPRPWRPMATSLRASSPSARRVSKEAKASAEWSSSGSPREPKGLRGRGGGTRARVTHVTCDVRQTASGSPRESKGLRGRVGARKRLSCTHVTCDVRQTATGLLAQGGSQWAWVCQQACCMLARVRKLHCSKAGCVRGGEHQVRGDHSGQPRGAVLASVGVCLHATVTAES